MAFATGSVGVLSEAIHSAFDLISSVVTFFVVRVSVRPADWDHPFGHGKIESLSALFEAVLLLAAGGYILFEAASKTLHPGHEVEHIGWGAAALGVSVFVNAFVYVQNRRVAHSEESIAIETNAFHFLADIFTSLAVFLSLALLYFTGWTFIDPIIAVFIAIYVFWVGIAQIKKCVAELSDTVLPEEELAQVNGVLKARASEFIGFHELRTRKAGSVRYIDMHLEICSDETVSHAHDTCDRIEDDLMMQFKEAQVNIHVEPCGNHSLKCAQKCLFHNKERSV